MAKFKEVDYKAPRTRWVLWVIPFLVVILLVLIGLFIYVTIGAKHHRCLIFDCEQPRDKVLKDPGELRNDVTFPPKEGPGKHVLDKTTENKSIGVVHKENFMITVKGKVIFDGEAPQSFPSNSHLKVTFQDVSIMDAASIVLGETLVDLSNYSGSQNLEYTIKCKMPSDRGRYSVSGVLNVGWRADEDSWIKKGDFFTDTSYSVIIEKGIEEYKKDIALVRYLYP